LNIVEALPIASGEMVANAAAWVGTKTWPMDKPMVNISQREAAVAPRVFRERHDLVAGAFVEVRR